MLEFADVIRLGFIKIQLPWTWDVRDTHRPVTYAQTSAETGSPIVYGKL